MSDIRTQRLAKLITNYCIGVRAGQLISIRGTTDANEFIAEIYKQVLFTGGRPILDLSFPGKNYIFYKYGHKEIFNNYHELEKWNYELTDALVAIDCDPNSRELSNIDHERIGMFRKSRRVLRDIWDKKEMEGKFKWVVVGYPLNSMAQEAGMSMEEYSDFVFTACGCNLEDPISYWNQESQSMQSAHKILENSKKIRIIGDKTDLTLNVTGRKWVICDGRLNMPDGEIFTSPIENSAEGEIFFDIPTTYNGVEAEGVYLKLKEGKVIESKANKGNDFLTKMLDIDEGARLIGEVAFGLNNFIQKPSKKILFDEKIGGSMHLAIGASYPEAGGVNKSGLHWDLIKNMKNGGQVELDGKKIYENGKFLF